MFDSYRDLFLTPMSDQDRISPHNINTISIRQVMRMYKSVSLTLFHSNFPGGWCPCRSVMTSFRCSAACDVVVHHLPAGWSSGYIGAFAYSVTFRVYYAGS